MMKRMCGARWSDCSSAPGRPCGPSRSGAAIDETLAEFRPDVLVLDIGMPGEDGYTLIRRIRRLARTEGGEIPAISLTAHARDEDRRHAMAHGFQAHLAKPVDVARLLSTVRELAGATESRLTSGVAGSSSPASEPGTEGVASA